MLNNLVNFFNLIATRKVRSTAGDNDLIALGVRDPRTPGIYQPSAIRVVDLANQFGMITVDSYTDLQNLINTNSLIPGQGYLIKNVDVPLYGGTDVLLKAATTNQLELQGHGIFYTPQYDQNIGGFGIWTDRVTLTSLTNTKPSPVDLGFNTPSLTPTNDLALQPDGKIIAVGGFFQRIRRLNTNGSQDNTFTIGTGFNNNAYAVALQSDGKVIVGGFFTSYNGNPCNRIARLNSDGTFDSTFNIGTGFNNTVFSLAIQSDGKILVGGNAFTLYNGTGVTSIVRLNTDGTLDGTFTPSAISSGVISITIQPDDKIVIGTNSSPGIRRLNTDGTTDGTFITGAGFNGAVRTKLQSDGKIIAVGNFTDYDGNPCNRIARLNTDGTFDFTFSIGSGVGGGSPSALDIQSDDKILIGGVFTDYDGIPQNNFARLNSDGTLDTTINLGDGFSSNVYTILEQPDGKILVGGWSLWYSNQNITFLGLERLNPTTFNFSGPVSQDSTTGTGSGWSINLDIVDSYVTVGSVNSYGYGYQTGDQITILGSQIGGVDGVDDIVFNVDLGITYAPGDTTIWGGYLWENLNGNLGSVSNIYNLNTEWQVIPYNETDYNVWVDEIHYDYPNDRIIYRKDVADNEVSTSDQNINYFQNNFGGDPYHPIKSFQWGNHFNGSVGVGENHMIDSLFQCINFRGSYLLANTLAERSWIYNNVFETGSYLSFNTLSQGSYFSNNTLEGSFFSYNTLSNGSNFFSNILSQGSYFGPNTLSGSSSFNNNTLSVSSAFNNILNQNSYFDYNTLSENSSFSNNTLSLNSYFTYNTLSLNSYFSYNTLSVTSNFTFNTLSENSYFSYNTLSENSNFTSNTLSENSYFYYNTLSVSSYFGSNTLSQSSNFQYNTLQNSYFTFNTLSQASYFTYNSLSENSNFNNNTLSENSYFTSNTLSQYSFFSSNTLSVSSYFGSNTLSQGSYFQYNTLSQGSFFTANTLEGSYFTFNTLSQASYFTYNSLSENSNFNNNTLSENSYFSYYTLSENSYFQKNTLSGSSIGNGTLSQNSYFTSNTLSEDSYFQYNTLSQGSHFIYNSLSQASYFVLNTLENSNFSSNTLNSSNFQNNVLDSGSNFSTNFLFNQSTFNFSPSGTLTGVILSQIEAKDANVNFDISLATDIYFDCSKTIFKNNAQVVRLSYYDATDALIVTDVDN